MAQMTLRQFLAPSNSHIPGSYLSYQAYPHQVSRLISLVKFVIRFFDTIYHSASLWKITIPWNSPRWSATAVILCACGIHILLSIRNTNKHFWCRCRGSNWLKISSNSLVKFTDLSPLILAGLPLLSDICDFCRAVQDQIRSTISLQLRSRRIGWIVWRIVVLPEETF